jgi:hypothetical protein
MLSIDKVLSLVDAVCECPEDPLFKCPGCMMGEVISHLNNQLHNNQKEQEVTKSSLKRVEKQVAALKVGVREARKQHNMHIESLNYYWHRKNIDCPCLIELKDKKGRSLKGKCKSHWITIKLEEEKPMLTRSQEIKLIDEFIERKKSDHTHN